MRLRYAEAVALVAGKRTIYVLFETLLGKSFLTPWSIQARLIKTEIKDLVLVSLYVSLNTDLT
jgi:hypothetical protein